MSGDLINQYQAVGCYARTLESNAHVDYWLDSRAYHECEDRFYTQPLLSEIEPKSAAQDITQQMRQTFMELMSDNLQDLPNGGFVGSTFLQVATQNRVITASWVGDSPAYVLRKKINGEFTIEKITNEHNGSVKRLAHWLQTREENRLTYAQAVASILSNFKDRTGYNPAFGSLGELNDILRNPDPTVDYHGRIDTGTNMYGSIGDGMSQIQRNDPEHITINLNTEPETEQAWILAATDGISDVLDDDRILPKKPNNEVVILDDHPLKIILLENPEAPEFAISNFLCEEARVRWCHYHARRAPDDITLVVSNAAHNRVTRVFDGHAGDFLSSAGYFLSRREFADQIPASPSLARFYSSKGGQKRRNLTLKDIMSVLGPADGRVSAQICDELEHKVAPSFIQSQCKAYVERETVEVARLNPEGKPLFHSQPLANLLVHNLTVQKIKASKDSVFHRISEDLNAAPHPARNMASYYKLLQKAVFTPDLKLAKNAHAVLTRQNTPKPWYERWCTSASRFICGDFYTKCIFKRMFQSQAEIDQYALTKEFDSVSYQVNHYRNKRGRLLLFQEQMRSNPQAGLTDQAIREGYGLAQEVNWPEPQRPPTHINFGLGHAIRHEVALPVKPQPKRPRRGVPMATSFLGFVPPAPPAPAAPAAPTPAA